MVIFDSPENKFFVPWIRSTRLARLNINQFKINILSIFLVVFTLIWGAIIRGRGTYRTFQSFKLAYLHVLRSQIYRQSPFYTFYGHSPKEQTMVLALNKQTIVSAHTKHTMVSARTIAHSYSAQLQLKYLNERTNIPGSSGCTWTMFHHPLNLTMQDIFFLLTKGYQGQRRQRGLNQRIHLKEDFILGLHSFQSNRF